ncbi:MAG TPA: MATE family efflux transporter [Eubacteriales bacterium]|nr:MATE family efflux transporter [Clostridia bacterium]HRV73909.1 MATE family efflux transporter [Eubacteriales bacterium]
MKKNDGTQRMTEGSIPKAIVRFALPILWGSLFQQMYNLVDALVVGNFVGKDALAAVTSSGTMIFMLVSLFVGVFMGAGVVISHHFGAKNTEAVQTAIHTDAAFALLAGVALTAIGVIFTPTLLQWINVPDEVMPNSVLYFRIYFCGSLFSIMYNCCNGIFQALGDSRHPLYYLIISSMTNVVLDLLFVAVFKWGIAGAAYATIISQALSCILALSRLLRLDSPYRLILKKIRIHRSMFGSILKMGIPSGIQNCIIALANLFVQANINGFGADAMAGCGAYSKVEGFVFMPISAFTMAITTFIGQNLGAKEFDRARRGLRFGIVTAMILAELMGLVVYFFGPVFIKAFNDTPAVIDFGTLQAHTCSLFYFLLAFSHGGSAVMRGAGRSVIPMCVFTICWCVIRVSYISVITRLVEGIQVVFWAYPLTWLISSIIFFFFLIKGDWVHYYEKAESKRRMKLDKIAEV